MTTAWRLASRSRWVLLLALVSAILVGWSLGSPRVEVNVRDVIQWFCSGVDRSLPVAMVLMTVWVFGPDDRPGLSRDRQAMGCPPRRWILQRLAWTAAAGSCWILVGLATAIVTSKLGGAASGDGRWLLPVGLVFLSAFLLIVWTAALNKVLGSSRAAVIMLCVSLAALGVEFFPPSGIAQLARVAIPVAALRAVHLRADFPGSNTLWWTCITVTIVWSLAAILALLSGHQPGSGPNRIRLHHRPRISTRVGLTITCILCSLACIIGGALVPGWLTRSLPVTAQPWLLLQRSQGKAPEQQAAAFALALRTQPARAKLFTRPGASHRLIQAQWAFAALPAGTRFTLVSIDHERHALVAATGTPLSLCLERSNDRWLVYDLPDQGQTCPS